jgi:hypothetical protein
MVVPEILTNVRKAAKYDKQPHTKAAPKDHHERYHETLDGLMPAPVRRLAAVRRIRKTSAG